MWKQHALKVLLASSIVFVCTFFIGLGVEMSNEAVSAATAALDAAIQALSASLISALLQQTLLKKQ